MSRRRVALVVGLLGLAMPALARSEEGAAAARKQATEMYQAFVRGDYATFVGYMHPKITELMGGRAKTLETIKKALAAAKAEGLTPANATAAPVPQFVEVAPSKLQVQPGLEDSASRQAGDRPAVGPDVHPNRTGSSAI